MTNMDTFSSQVLAFAATYWIHSTLLLGACWLFFRFFKRPPYALADRGWKIASVLGLLTAGLHSSVDLAAPTGWHFAPSGGSWVDDPPQTSTVSRGASAQDASQWFVRIHVESPDLVDEPFANTVDVHSPSAGQIRATSAPETAAERSAFSGLAPTSPLTLSRTSRVYVAMGWVFWVVGSLAYLAIAHLQFRRRIERSTRIVRGRVRKIVDRMDGSNHRIRILSSECQTQPIAFGILRPTILLPTDFEQRISKDELAAALAHEVAHLARRDVWWLWIGRILCLCFAFQPLNFIARRRWQAAAEFMCDAWAIGRGVCPLTLAKSLTSIASWQIKAPAVRCALTAAGSKSLVVKRVARLISDEVPVHRWRPKQQAAFYGSVVTLAVAFMFAAPSIRGTDRDPAARSIVGKQRESGLGQWQALQSEVAALEQEMERATELIEAGNPSPQLRQSIRDLKTKQSLFVDRLETLEQRFQ